MSISSMTYVQSGLSDRLKWTSLNPTTNKYAFRIGFIGDSIDRFEEGLLGKVLEEKSFSSSSVDMQKLHKGTAFAKWLLEESRSDKYETKRQRLIAATVQSEYEEEAHWQVQQAVAWLQSMEVQQIFFQHKWMLLPELPNELYSVEQTLVSMVNSC